MTGRHPFLDHPLPTAVAHRGGSLEAEENTMEAFARAVGLGYTHVETDVHATRDGVAVIHHDPTLERMTGQTARIADLDWADVARIRTHGGAAIPRAEELLAAFPRLNITFELKCDRVAGPLAEVITRADALGRVCVGSFAAARTAAMRGLLGPGLSWSPAQSGVLALWLAGHGLPMRRPGFAVVQVPRVYKGLAVVTPRFIRAAARRGIDVQVWTVDDAPAMARLLDMGVSAILTDRPSVLRRVLEERGQWHGGA
ncbi:glycerophosphodiester phosphodiesterase family protein [Roseicyclus amphidinii]|jgi:glycerophosphoryl diester phosphodiesterase|uniref:glycerophosphodiester phosphodiesterase family protein n=1 Tax=Roseicyclus amphidinii TaxID=3034232 RepID=UPI0024E15978|nr:glycerophosphodiester phosphodiesterase family protein [Roseicyclus sp. Amp-Y-6]